MLIAAAGHESDSVRHLSSASSGTWSTWITALSPSILKTTEQAFTQSWHQTQSYLSIFHIQVNTAYISELIFVYIFLQKYPIPKPTAMINGIRMIWDMPNSQNKKWSMMTWVFWSNIIKNKTPTMRSAICFGCMTIFHLPRFIDAILAPERTYFSALKMLSRTSALMNWFRSPLKWSRQLTRWLPFLYSSSPSVKGLFIYILYYFDGPNDPFDANQDLYYKIFAG